MSAKAKPEGQELFEQAMKNYEEAMEAGLKLQQDAARWWMDTISKAGSAQEWQARTSELMNKSISTVQERLDQNLKVLEQTGRTSIDLLKKAVAAGKADTVAGAQSKMQDLLEASLDAMRSSAGSIHQANAKWLESFSQFMPKAKSAA